MHINRNTIISAQDVETENLNLLTTRPWQLSYNFIKNRKIIEERDRYIWWEDLNISEDAARITRFNYEKYKSLALPSQEVAEEYAEVLYDPKIILVFHNGFGFDLAVIMNWLKREKLWRGWKDIPQRTIDSMLMLRIYNNGGKPEKDNFLGSQLKEIGKPPRGSAKSSLGAGCKLFSIEYSADFAHDSLYDVQKTGELTTELIYKLDIFD